ncbi:MAG TPA: RDD family protein [Candidatus Methanoperedens sp.]
MEAIVSTVYNIKYARFGRRFVAETIDSLIIIFIGGILGLIVDYFYNMIGGNRNNINILFIIVFFIIFYIYEAGMESSFQQATIGKKALGMIVTDLDGNRISFGQASIRFIAKNIIPFAYITILFTKKKQGLHDFIAGTLVINKQKSSIQS